MIVRRLVNIIAIFIVGVAGGIFADQILWPYLVERPLFYKYNLEQPPIYVTEKKEIIIRENEALIEAVERVAKSVIGVKTQTKDGKIIEGSGIILTSDGLLVTLSSLLPQGEKFSFYWEGQLLSYEISKRDLKQDLALVKLEANNLPTVSFRESGLKLGERVFLTGAVFNGNIVQKLVNEGIIKTFDQDFIKTNIFEAYFLSGSPLFDIEGKFVGLNTVDKQGKVIAIPAAKIRAFAGL